MKIPQSSNARVELAAGGTSITFGREVPPGLLLFLDPGSGEGLNVEPGDRFVFPFNRAWIEFPASVNSDPLEVLITGTLGEPMLERAPLPRAELVLAETESMLSGLTFTYTLPPMGPHIGGTTRATKLAGSIRANTTGNLCLGTLFWDSKFGMLEARYARFAATSSAQYLNVTGWDYPQDGGELQIKNGASAKTLKISLWAVTQ